MILTCPSCSTRYLVDPSAIGQDGRMVRCASCNHSWFQRPPEDLPKPVDLTPPEQIRMRPMAGVPALARTRRSRPRLRWAGTVAAVALVVVLAVLLRGPVVAAWPGAAPIYAAVGLPVDVVGAGLALQGVKTDRGEQNGVPVVVIDGRIANISHQTRAVPLLRATSVSTDRKALKSWTFKASRDQLAPGEIATFHSTLSDPEGTAAEVSITFDHG